MTEPWTSDPGGPGTPIVLLHPGGTDSRSMSALAEAFGGARVVLVDRAGHGRSPDVDGPWHFVDMAEELAGTVRSLGAGPVHLVGWSDGAIVGLHLALAHPDLVRSLVFGGAPFSVDGWHEGVLDGDPPRFMADAYAEVSPDPPEHWEVVTAKSRVLHTAEPAVTVAQLGGLDVPVLILCGDDDEVRLDPPPRCSRHCRTASSRWSRGRRTASSSSSRTSSRSSSRRSTRPTRATASHPAVARGTDRTPHSWAAVQMPSGSVGGNR